MRPVGQAVSALTLKGRELAEQARWLLTVALALVEGDHHAPSLTCAQPDDLVGGHVLDAGRSFVGRPILTPFFRSTRMRCSLDGTSKYAPR